MSQSADSIDELRAHIDSVDDEIAAALQRRRALVAALREEKAQRGVAFVDPAREAVIEARYRRVLSALSSEQLHTLVRAVLESSR